MSKTILLIDDDTDFRLMLKKLLETNRYRVFDAKNGTEGMSIMQTEEIELVVTDIIMPDMDGIETIMKIRSDYPGTPMIAISGGGRIGPADYLNAAHTLGASRVMAKPFTNEDFLEQVQEALAESS